MDDIQERARLSSLFADAAEQARKNGDPVAAKSAEAVADYFYEPKPIHRVVTVTVTDLTDLDELTSRLEDMRDSDFNVEWNVEEFEDA